MLHLAKGRRALVYTWPMPAITAGTTWEAEFPVWNEDGSYADLDIGPATVEARISERHRDNVRATGNTVVGAGLITWAFPPSATADLETEVYRFTLDVTLETGEKQRLIDSALPVRGSYRRRDDYGSN
jgi:hypothetical protein